MSVQQKVAKYFVSVFCFYRIMVKMYPKAFVLLTLTTKSSIRIFVVEWLIVFISTKNHFKGNILSLVLVQNISFPLSSIALVLPATKELGYITRYIQKLDKTSFRKRNPTTRSHYIYIYIQCVPFKTYLKLDIYIKYRKIIIMPFSVVLHRF